MAKQLKEFLESFEFNRAAIAKQRLANLRHSGRRVRGARIANLMRAAGLKEEEMDETDLDQLDEVLNADATASDWIHDFVHSTNPKFEGKSKKERIKMALGAYYNKAKTKQQNEETEQIDEISLDTMKSAKEKLGHKAIEAHYDDNKRLARHYAQRALSMGSKIKRKEWKQSNEETEQIDEISGELASRYLQKKHDRDYEKTGPYSSRRKESQTMDQAIKDGANTARALKRIGPLSKIGKKVNEETENKKDKKEDLPFDPDPPKKNPSATAGKYGQGYSTARHLARQGMKQAMKEEYGVDISDEIADQILEAAKQFTGPVKVQVQSDKEAHEEKWESAKKKPVKEQYDEEGNLITMPKTYQEFMEAMTATKVAPNVTRYTGGSYGNAKGAKYGNTDYDKETLDTKDDEGTETQKRGRGRPAGSKSGARGPRIK